MLSQYNKSCPVGVQDPKEVQIASPVTETDNVSHGTSSPSPNIFFSWPHDSLESVRKKLTYQTEAVPSRKHIDQNVHVHSHEYGVSSLDHLLAGVSELVYYSTKASQRGLSDCISMQFPWQIPQIAIRLDLAKRCLTLLPGGASDDHATRDPLLRFCEPQALQQSIQIECSDLYLVQSDPTPNVKLELRDGITAYQLNFTSRRSQESFVAALNHAIQHPSNFVTHEELVENCGIYAIRDETQLTHRNKTGAFESKPEENRFGIFGIRNDTLQDVELLVNFELYGATAEPFPVHEILPEQNKAWPLLVRGTDGSMRTLTMRALIPRRSTVPLTAYVPNRTLSNQTSKKRASNNRDWEEESQDNHVTLGFECTWKTTLASLFAYIDSPDYGVIEDLGDVPAFSKWIRIGRKAAYPSTLRLEDVYMGNSIVLGSLFLLLAEYPKRLTACVSILEQDTNELRQNAGAVRYTLRLMRNGWIRTVSVDDLIPYHPTTFGTCLTGPWVDLVLKACACLMEGYSCAASMSMLQLLRMVTGEYCEEIDTQNLMWTSIEEWCGKELWMCARARGRVNSQALGEYGCDKTWASGISGKNTPPDPVLCYSLYQPSHWYTVLRTQTVERTSSRAVTLRSPDHYRIHKLDWKEFINTFDKLVICHHVIPDRGIEMNVSEGPLDLRFATQLQETVHGSYEAECILRLDITRTTRIRASVTIAEENTIASLGLYILRKGDEVVGWTGMSINAGYASIELTLESPVLGDNRSRGSRSSLYYIIPVVHMNNADHDPCTTIHVCLRSSVRRFGNVSALRVTRPILPSCHTMVCLAHGAKHTLENGDVTLYTLGIQNWAGIAVQNTAPCATKAGYGIMNLLVNRGYSAESSLDVTAREPQLSQGLETTEYQIEFHVEPNAVKYLVSIHEEPGNVPDSDFRVNLSEPSSSEASHQKPGGVHEQRAFRSPWNPGGQENITPMGTAQFQYTLSWSWEVHAPRNSNVWVSTRDRSPHDVRSAFQKLDGRSTVVTYQIDGSTYQTITGNIYGLL